MIVVDHLVPVSVWGHSRLFAATAINLSMSVMLLTSKELENWQMLVDEMATSSEPDVSEYVRLFIESLEKEQSVAIASMPVIDRHKIAELLYNLYVTKF